MRKFWIAALVAGLASSAVNATLAQSGVTVLALPEAAAYPEGVTVDPATGAVYTNSANTGLVFRVDPDTGKTSLVGDPLDMALPSRNPRYQWLWA